MQGVVTCREMLVAHGGSEVFLLNFWPHEFELVSYLGINAAKLGINVGNQIGSRTDWHPESEANTCVRKKE